MWGILEANTIEAWQERLEARLGKGRVVLYGFPPQYRAQSDAAFKLLFNALLG